MQPGDDEKKNANLATTVASVAIDTAKLITGVPLDYPDPLLTPLATVPQPAKEVPIMDDEKEKPVVDQMTDVVADAAGELAKTAMKAVARHTPKPVKKAAKAVSKAAKATKKKKAAKKVATKTKKAAKKSAAKKTAKKKKSKAKKSKSKR